MSKNIYAEEIFADNPTCIWMLDESLSVLGVADNISIASNNIAVTQTTAVTAEAYGNIQSPGYYLSSAAVGNAPSLFVRNNGMPMVFGANSVTNVLPNSVANQPSLIVPGFGFLNKDGIQKSLTLEAWIRVTSTTHYQRRIIGPIGSTDGIYVDGPFITLKVGQYTGSHYVGEWGRPMHIIMYYTPNSSGLILNGEQVILLSFDSHTISLPNRINNTTLKDQDWIGFYAYSNVPLIQLDCVAIYPYQVSTKIAKLHFNKGESVESPEVKNLKYIDVPIIADYAFANYANNYVYPGTGRWENGIYENVSTNSNRLGSPNYSLPTVSAFVESTETTPRTFITYENWLSQQKTGQTETTSLSSGSLLNDNTYYKIKSNASISAGHIYFDKINVTDKPVESVYGIFEVASLPTAKQTLIKIVNDFNQSFEVSLLDNDISYKFTSGENTYTVAFIENSVSVNTKFAVGVNLSAISTSAVSQDLIAFFSNRASLKMYVGGSGTFTETFDGKIYKVGFANSSNTLKISSEFTNGIVNFGSTALRSHIASYTLIGIYKFGKYILDIAVNGIWEDYVPLSMLAKEVVVDSAGNKAYKLDFVQHNIDYPDIDSTANALVRTYVEFKEIASSVVSSTQIQKTNIAVPASYIVEPDADWVNKRYEIKNNTIIKLPTGGYDDFEDLSLSTFIELFIPGIISNPISIRTLHLAGQATKYWLPTDTANYDTYSEEVKSIPSIGTKLGKDVYSYAIVNNKITYNPSSINTYSVYKNTTPYFYLSNYTGFRVLGTITGSRGIRIPINQSAFTPDYNVNYIQASMLSTDNFATGTTEIFRVIEDSSEIVIYADGTGSGGEYASLSAKYANGTAYTGATFYIDGVLQQTSNNALPKPKVYKNQWHMIGVQFFPLLTFASNPNRSIMITGPFIMNNISDYQVPADFLKGNQTYDTWSEYLDKPDADNNWSNVALESWKLVYEDVSLLSGAVLSPTAIYNTYIGNNRIVADEIGSRLNIYPSEYKIYINNTWSSYKKTPL